MRSPQTLTHDPFVRRLTLSLLALGTALAAIALVVQSGAEAGPSGAAAKPEEQLGKDREHVWNHTG